MGIKAFGEDLWLKEEVIFERTSPLGKLRGYDGTYEIIADFETEEVVVNRLGLIEIDEDEKSIIFRDGENYKDTDLEVEDIKRRFIPIDYHPEWETIQSLEDLVEYLKKYGHKEGSLLALPAYETEVVSFNELDEETLDRLKSLIQTADVDRKTKRKRSL